MLIGIIQTNLRRKVSSIGLPASVGAFAFSRCNHTPWYFKMQDSYTPNSYYLFIYLFISTLYQNHLHKDRFLTAVYFFLLVFFCISAETQKKASS
jgi:hypothetical protein